MSNIEIKRIERIEPIQRSGATIVAKFDVSFGDIAVGGIALVQYQADKTVGIFAPRQRATETRRSGYVRFTGPLLDQVIAAATKAFVGIGGEFPEPVRTKQDEPQRKRTWVCAPPGYHPDEDPSEIAEMLSTAFDRAERQAVAREEAERACG